MKIGIIGGSGLEDPKFFGIVNKIGKENLRNDFGEPSSDLHLAKINKNEVVFLSRHGKQHTIPPTQVNYRANIRALQDFGCNYILATTAVGSLREEIKRGDFVIPDQFIDFTRHRFSSFYDNFSLGDVKHTQMSDPFSKLLREKVIKKCEDLKILCHKKGTVVTIEGPRFSTKAESKMFRMWGADIINMSISSEVILANEIGIDYVAIAMSTDYDCWKENEVPVCWEEILKIFGNNSEKMKSLLLSIIKDF